MAAGEVYEKVVDATRDLVKGLGLEVVDARIEREKGRTVLRSSLDKPGGGLTLDECAGASDLLGQVLEREEVVKGPYVLEVMSPGIDRPLRRRADYAGSVGKRIKVNLRQPYEGRVAFRGILVEASGESVRLDLGTEQIDLSYEAISSARLDPELPW